ncbi:inositol monophosphatase family protein [Bordetella genomosp. 9]|uniref:Inositol monophosphatase n=1 Tax=Bordetella genomosp. 9 TaxID=1416803 RepID=A0A1W6Z210_9BORD|nr:inositol monophosphatase family protein [Bordetella genomosp. 9]ARP87405.1 inositol monophosphatase [Bordetella genomosp. 9]ARP91385.1 inositol monophosphatase [Bordetella genomosp. 9]
MLRSFSREEIRRIAAILAEAAATEIMPRFRNLAADAVRNKTSALDLVTDADESAERFIGDRLSRIYPNAVMVGEEACSRNPALLNVWIDAELAFLIDPIDGTRNYVAGLPLFGVMVAAVSRGEVMAGIIYDPVCRDAAVALRGEGAWLENEHGAQTPLQVAAPVPAEQMVGLIAAQQLDEPLRAAVNANALGLASSTILNCSAHEYRMLAGGHAHVLLYGRLMPWDHAAGWLLHHEAGGYSAHFDGTPYKPTHRGGGLLYAPDAGSWKAAHRLLMGENSPA